MDETISGHDGVDCQQQDTPMRRWATGRRQKRDMTNARKRTTRLNGRGKQTDGRAAPSPHRRSALTTAEARALRRRRDRRPLHRRNRHLQLLLSVVERPMRARVARCADVMEEKNYFKPSPRARADNCPSVGATISRRPSGRQRSLPPTPHRQFDKPFVCGLFLFHFLYAHLTRESKPFSAVEFFSAPVYEI